MYIEYPSIAIYLVLVTGIFLAFIRPYWAFLMVVFGFAAIDNTGATNTRVFLGPYFNLNDAFLLVGMIAAFMGLIRDNKRIRIPRVLILLLVVWAIGTLQGIRTLGWQYEGLREARWALNFPLAILLGSNLVKEERRARSFLLTLFIGALVRSIQHILFMTLLSDQIAGPLHSSRPLGFIHNPGIYLLAAATQGPIYWKEQTRPVKLLSWGSILLFGTSLLLSSTRSMWIAMLVSPLVLALILKNRRVIWRLALIGAGLLIAVPFIFSLAVPRFSATEVLTEGYRLLVDEDLRDQTTLTRRNALIIETRMWLNGNLLIGRGFGYQWLLPYGSDASVVAWGHLAYVTYLARLGLLGLLSYGIYLPLIGMRSARRLYFQFPGGTFRLLALIGLATFIFDAITFITSSSYLNPQLMVSGFLYGSVLGLAETTVPNNLKRDLNELSQDHGGDALLQPATLPPRNY